MDKLQSVQDQLCGALSCDPDYIVKQCGNKLLMNEFLEIRDQSSPYEKMKVLLNIIVEKGEETCQWFWGTLRNHQSRYPQLPQLVGGSLTPTVYADGCSVVSIRENTNVTAESLTNKIEIVGAPAGNPVGPVPQALHTVNNYTATGGSVILADKNVGLNINGPIDFSVSLKASQVCTEKVEETLPSSQGSAVKTIVKHKVELIDCLRADHAFILQHVHAKGIVTDRQYQQLKHISQPEETVTKLIDQVIDKGQETCSRFLEVLKQPDFLSTYPQLKGITKQWC